MIIPPYFPIIYLRGYAGTQQSIDDTVSTPYMGFNLGSTRIRQAHTGKVVPQVFESPVIRLMKDHGYVDAYRDGQLLPGGPTPSRSIWIFRYYDVGDEFFGEGERKEIEFHAERLSEFLRYVRNSVLDVGEHPDRFRAYLVAHSMGGLICRCYLQNPDIPDINGRIGDEKMNNSLKGIDKVFTYGTPHGGIEFRSGLGWLEGLRDFFDTNNAGNFGSKRMREFLALPSEGKENNNSLHSLNGCYPEERFFCLVGTDARDYNVAGGLSRWSVGPLSDGLVKIEKASVSGAPRGYIHRSHSGPYGIVNSESGYQNLRRFLFGDIRVLVEMRDVVVTLPKKVEKKKLQGKAIRASYHIDVNASVRGVPVEINRRTYDENSAIFRNYTQLTQKPTILFTAFLMESTRVNTRRQSLGFALRLQIRVPEYEIDNTLFFDDYYEGANLFSDKLNFEITHRAEGDSQVRYGWDSRTPNRSLSVLALDRERQHQNLFENGVLAGTLPFSSGRSHPAVSGNIRLYITRWNDDSK